MTIETPDTIETLPPFVSVTRTSKALGLSRATVWRYIKTGVLQVASGSTGHGKKNLILKTSIERFAAPAEVKP